VSVNGTVVNTLGSQADLRKDYITVDGERIKPEKKCYFMLNKPRGVICSASDQWGRRLVGELVSDVPERLYTVGRLDRDAQGLVLLTNDGDFAQRVAHPRQKVQKTYELRVKGSLSARAKTRLEKGMRLDGRKTAPASVRITSTTQSETVLTIIITEGRKRQLKRMLMAVGHPVKRLRRVAIGRLALGSLPPGNYRKLRPKELDDIFKPVRRVL
jgi:23S rRNA pseudouridine2605 synthase